MTLRDTGVGDVEVSIETFEKKKYMILKKDSDLDECSDMLMLSDQVQVNELIEKLEALKGEIPEDLSCE